MKELVVISGKGGTGKTSVTASFAVLSGANLVVADCDVDAPDLHFLLQPEVKQEHPFTASELASIDFDACTECGECVLQCRFGAIRPDFTVDEVACEGCGLCELVCPHGAVSLNEVVSGYWFSSTIEWGHMLHARLNYAEGNSGKLVSKVKEQTRKAAQRSGADMILLDGPPGTGCPVIASLAGASYALLITEPSTAALHDLSRVHQICKHFEISTGLCINKWDLNEEMSGQIEAFCTGQDVPVLGHIPHDPQVTAAMLQGKTVVQENNTPAAVGIRKLYKKVQRVLRQTEVDDIEIQP